MAIANCMVSSTLMLLVFVTSEVHGYNKCYSERTFSTDFVLCSDDEFCCGQNNLDCCSFGRLFDVETIFSGVSTSGDKKSITTSTTNNNSMEAIFGLLLLVIIFVGCLSMCYRCCCRRTTSRGFVYSQAAGTTTNMSVSLPPGSQQPVPYPTVVPYPQQTPYHPQYPINPYYGVPPPAYGLPVQAGVQEASAPTAPPYAQS